MSTQEPASSDPRAAAGPGPPDTREGRAALAPYLLVEGWVADREVLVASAHAAAGIAILTQAGCRRVEAVQAWLHPLPRADESTDVILCFDGFEEGAPALVRWLAEVRRVLRPDGFVVVRVPAAPPSSVGSENASQERPGGGAGFEREGLERLVADVFPASEVLSEAPFVGVAFSGPSSEDVALNEALASPAGRPSHFLVLGARGRSKPWQTSESLLVPLATGLAVDETAAGVEAQLRAQVTHLERRVYELSGERERLHEAVMAAGDQRDRRDAALAALRREADRHLQQIGAHGQALELQTLERDQAIRRAEAAEKEEGVLAVQLRRREAEVAGLEHELRRMQARLAKV